MSTSEITVEGKVKWHKHRAGQVDKYGKLTVQFYPKDKETRDLINKLKLRGSMKEDDDGFYFTFGKKLEDRYHPGEPLVYLQDGTKTDKSVGNGSDVLLTLEVYTWNDRKLPNGELITAGVGARWVKTEVLNLVEYVRPEGTSVGVELPV